MPVLNILGEEGGLAAFAPSELMAAMTYPKDDDKRDLFLVSSYVGILINVDKEIPEDEGSRDFLLEYCLSRLHRSDSHETLIKRAVKAQASSWVAGEILLYLLRVSEHHPELQPSPSKIVYLLSLKTRDENARTYTGRRPHSSRRFLWQWWSRFRSVAHLHAVRNLWIHQTASEGEPDVAGLNDLMGRRTLEYLAVAEDFRKKGEAARFLSPDETWRAPGELALPEMGYTLTPLSDQSIDRLRQYTPEHSRGEFGP